MLSWKTLYFHGFLISLLYATNTLAIPLELKDIPAKIRHSNILVRSSELDMEISQQSRKQALSGYYPSIELNGQYTQLNDAIKIDIPAQRLERDILNTGVSIQLDLDPPPFTVREKNFSNLHFLLKQPLYTGGRIQARNDVALSELNIQRSLREQSEEQETIKAIQRYYQIKLNGKIIASFHELKARLDRIHQISQSLIRSGLSPSYAKLRTEVALAELDAKLQSAKTMQEVLLGSLAYMIDEQDLRAESLTSELKILTVPDQTSYWLEMAKNRRVEIALSRERQKQAKAMQQAAKGSLMPQVFAFGKYELLPDQLTALEPQWLIGIGFQLSLTAGLQALPEGRKATLLHKKAQLAEERADREISLQIEQALAKVQGSQASLQAIEKSLELSKEALRITELSFASGKSSHLEVLSHFNDLEKLEISRWQAVEEHNRHILELYVAASAIPEYINSYSDR